MKIIYRVSHYGPQMLGASVSFFFFLHVLFSSFVFLHFIYEKNQIYMKGREAIQ